MCVIVLPMKEDRFKNYEEDVKELVLGFERMQRQGGSQFYDVEEIETIIDFYLETADGEGLEKSVRYGENLFPQSNEIKLRRVHLLCFKERYEEAYRLLKQLESIEPDDTDVLYALGVVHSELNQPRKAVQYYHKAAEDGYELGIIYSNIGDEYVKMEKYAEARSYYRRAIRLNPNDEHSLYELSNCYEDENLIDQWTHFFSRFVKDNPYSKAAWFCLGEAYLMGNKLEQASDAYQYALTVDDNYMYAYEQLASCYCAMQRFQDAVNVLHEAVNHTEDKAYIYFRIAEIFMMINNPVTSNIYYTKAVHEDPYYAEAWLNMAMNYSMMHEFYAAVDAAKRAVRIDPESPIFLTTLALIYADNGENEEAERIFDCAKNSSGDFEHGWITYADYFISRQRYDEAIEVLTKGLNESDTTLEFYKRLALCYYFTGRHNMLYNAVRACLYDGSEGEAVLLEYLPELENDSHVMDIITSYRNERGNSTSDSLPF